LHNPEGIATNRAGLYDVEDHVELSCQLTCGSPFSASWDFAGTERQDLITITGDKAELTLSTFGNEPVAFTPHHGDTQTFDLPNPKHIQQPLIQTIIHDLNGQGACVSTGESAARTSHVMDAVLQNYYGPRADGFWNNPDAWPGRSAR